MNTNDTTDSVFLQLSTDSAVQMSADGDWLYGKAKGDEFQLETMASSARASSASGT